MKFEDRKKFSVHLDISSMKQTSFLNYPLSTKRKIDTSPLSPASVSPNNSFLQDSKFKPIKPMKQTTKQYSLKQMLSTRSPIGKENMQRICKFPMNIDTFVRSYPLSKLETQELTDIKMIYYYKSAKNLDSPDGEYVCQVRDHIQYRYEIISLLGSGSFGQVFEVKDHRTIRIFAMKMIRNQEKLKKQAAVEANILKYIKEQDTNQISNIVVIEDSFLFRGHQCIVFEKLDQNLYELLRVKRYRGFDQDLLKKIAIQILTSLNFLNKHKIIHCDIKPENILLQDSTKSGIKMVDFGSSCFTGQQVYTYIQSRYYRAPEVIFGLKYGMEIDMWSFACLIAELHIGQPIFPGEDEMHQVALIMEVIGAPSKEWAQKLPRRKYFFDEEGNPKKTVRNKQLHDVLKTTNDDFVDFLLKCFTWDASQRISPLDALRHPWVIQVLISQSQQGLPQEIKISHQKYIEIERSILNGKKKLNLSKLNDDSYIKLNSDIKPILSCRYNDKPISVEKTRSNIAQSIHNLLNSKPVNRKPSLFQF
ncbi:hypothetical protein pb186bvf_008757 [Paramecium bursaria]